jgi:murein DD-endopeptidase MepM/ murein hydrolase activator NlpD
MSDRVAFKRTATAGRLVVAGLTAALLGGCSADALRMESFSSPLAGFSNPFSGMMGGDKTGSIETPAPRAIPRAPTSTFTPPPAPSGDLAKYAPPVGGPVTGWSAAGGSSVVMANGESLNTLSQRYGVPEQAILKANGLGSASQLTPGTRLTIPVYNAGSAAAASAASTVRSAAPAPAKFDAPVVSRAAAASSETRAAQARLEEERARLAAARKEAAQAKAELEAEKRKAAVETRRAQSASLAAQTKDAKAEKAQAEAAQMKLRQERLARLKAEEEASHKKVAAAKAEVKKQSRVEARARDEEAKERKRADAADKGARKTADARSADAKIADAKTAEAKAAKSEKARKEAEAKAEKDAAKARKLADAKAGNEAKAAEAKSAEAKAAEAKAAEAKSAEAKTKAELKAAEAKAKAEQKAADAKAKAEQETTRVARTETKPEAAKPEPATTASVKPETTTSAANGNPEFRWPARGRVIQGFRSNGNDGINIALPEGTAVKAAESGVVAYAGSELKNLGNLVLIRHPNGYVSAYAHNGDLEVKRGDSVKRGQTIAKSGQSGAVQSPQLHFELRKGSTPVDPTQYLAGL